MGIARLLVSFKLPDSGQAATVGVDIENYSALTAKEVVAIIARNVNEQFKAPVWHKAEILNIVELQPRIQTMYTQEDITRLIGCIACGDKRGHGGLPCPTTVPMS